MNAQKIITTTENVDLNINGITLISIEEAKLLPINMRRCKDHWWLCSPGSDNDHVAFVICESGSIYEFGAYVEGEFGVRPALIISNLKSYNLQIYDKVKLFDYTWTIISKNLALCDEIIGKCKFREDWKSLDANKYETSDVKKWLENWYNKENEKIKYEDNN